MKNLSILILSLLILTGCKNEADSSQANATSPSIESAEKADFAIVIHGGAGTILKKNMTPEKEAAYKAVLEEAIRTGYDILKNASYIVKIPL